MNVQNPLIFDINRIYTLVHKNEEPGFNFVCSSRVWDGFVLVTNGECIFKKEKEKAVTLGQRSIVFLKRNESYTISSSQKFSYYTTAFDFSPESEKTLFFLPKISECDTLQLKTVQQVTENWQRQSADSYMFCKIQLLKFYFDIIKNTPANRLYSTDVYVNKAIKFIHANFKRNFTSEEISVYCSLSQSYLRKRFLIQTGMTIWEYRDRLRFRLAKELLSSGVFSVKEAAFELGFCDVYYFTKFFSKYAGITPGKYMSNKTDND